MTKKPLKLTETIPNINLGDIYDQRYVNAEIHYESLGNLAEFFGRDMPVHHHDRFFQVHIILSGAVHIHLDEKSYSTKGPMFFFTPPTVPHAFTTDNETKGYVITARQALVWELMEDILQNSGYRNNTFLTTPLCMIFPLRQAVLPNECYNF